MQQWLWQQPQWTNFTWQSELIQPRLRQCWKHLGELVGVSRGQPPQTLQTLLTNLVSSSAIEGENLNVQSLRSSLAKRLGLSQTQPYPVSERTEGLSDILFDALENWQQPISLARLLQWHRWLFPASLSFRPAHIGELRGDEPMQVVSGRIDAPKVHFEAPPRQALEAELARFIDWFNRSQTDANLDPLVRAGICHLWLLTLHPFEDGNGRLTRALTDLALAQADQQSVRLYSISSVILAQRKSYYEKLETSQKATSEISEWLVWFLDMLDSALQQSLAQTQYSLQKARFWARHSQVDLSESQRKVLNRLLQGGEENFPQGINANQYQKVAKVSKATATRHLSELVAKGLLNKSNAGGRSTRYFPNLPADEI